MSGNFIGIRFELGQAIFSSYDSNGILHAQPDGLGDAPKVASFEVLAPLGFSARAPAAKTDPHGAPQDGGGAKLLIWRDGTDRYVSYFGDHRDLAGIPPLPDEGGAVMYAPGSPKPSFYVLNSKDGSQQIYVERGNSAHVITIGTDANGDELLEVTHADGQGIRFFKRAAIMKNCAGDAYIELNDSGIVLNGNVKIVGDISDSIGISLLHHTHLSPVGPTAPPLPSV